MKIGLKNVVFHAFHGYFEEERIYGHDFLINIEVEWPDPIFKEEMIDTTVDYGQIFNICDQEMKKPRKLLETVARSILEIVKNDFPAITSAWIRIEKQGPQLGGRLEASYVEFHL